DGTLVPLPKPSVDTGMGLERLSAVMQKVTNNYHTDVFSALIEEAEKATGIDYRGRESDDPYWFELSGNGRRSASFSPAVKSGNRVFVDPASFRVIADHARAVAFLLADGVFPSNEGRGYVLRRILRRAVRHAWLLGRAAPTLVDVVQRVVDTMGHVFPELKQRAKHIVDTTRAEEQRFLDTIDGGMGRFDELAPETSMWGSQAIKGTIAGEDVFKLYDTFGFPVDLTELMARERGYTVDIAGFESALAAQRSMSQQERKSKKVGAGVEDLGDNSWLSPDEVRFVGYETTEADTEVTAFRALPEGRVAVMLRETPFYAESGGQVADRGSITGEGWSVDVDQVRRVDGKITVVGKADGSVAVGPAKAVVPREPRLDTERNHTATHLLHAALRTVLGEHVHQAGSLVAPDRLRFDFTHHGPMTPSQIREVEDMVNREVLAAIPVTTTEQAYAEAVASGAMALFGEKYGEVVRVVNVPGVSVELCGGTHVRNTSEIGSFLIASETGVAAGVRRVEAMTGPRAYAAMREKQNTLGEIAKMLRASPNAVVKRLHTVLDEHRTLEKRLDEVMRSGGANGVQQLIDSASDVDGVRVVASPVSAPDVKSLQALGDALRENLKGGVGVLSASFEDGKHALLVVVADDLRERGLSADAIVKQVAAVAGGRGGGKPHMAQAGVPDASKLPEALAAVPGVIRAQLAN
ncbi:MAG: alanine--tRNA ligase, partial [Gemmatimonadales bacterium]